MSPIISVTESFALWALPVPVICVLIYLGFIKGAPASAKASKQIPSPVGVPGLGDALDIKREQPWIRYAQLAAKLGPILKLNTVDQTHIVISDDKIAQTLLQERGVNYSDRPWFNFTCGLLTGNLHLLLLSNGDRFCRYRAFLHSVMSSTRASTYDSMQMIEAKRMIDSLISAPNQYDRWLDRSSASLMARLIWGKRVERGDEEFVRTLHDIKATFEKIGSRGSQIYNKFPSLLRLPDWIAPLKKTARRLHMWETNFLKRLVNETRLDMGAGIAQPSFARHFVLNKATTGLSETEAAHALGSTFEAGTDMIGAHIKSFCLALCLHPEWQDKIQTEIDAVCGDRMPEFTDMPSLPVTRAVLVEVARWRPACPGGMPHVLSQDDTYDGYYFQNGTTFHPNTWALTRDPVFYPSPNTFNPARWLTPSYPTFRSPLSSHPSLSQSPSPLFGYGPRRCPGLHIAERTLFIQAAYIGWACTLKLKPGTKITDTDFVSTGLACGMGSVWAPRRWEFDALPRMGRDETVRREASRANVEDPLGLGAAGGKRRVERIAFKREGAWNPDL